MNIEIREASPTDYCPNGRFYVYVDGAYHCTCMSREEAERLIDLRFAS